MSDTPQRPEDVISPLREASKQAIDSLSVLFRAIDRVRAKSQSVAASPSVAQARDTYEAARSAWYAGDEDETDRHWWEMDRKLDALIAAVRAESRVELDAIGESHAALARDYNRLCKKEVR